MIITSDKGLVKVTMKVHVSDTLTIYADEYITPLMVSNMITELHFAAAQAQRDAKS